MTSIAALAGVAFALVTSRAAQPRADLVGVAAAPTTASTAAATTAPSRPLTEAAAVPSHLRIPSIGVDAPVVAVGLDADGTMQVPGPTEVGWYEPGARPGSAEGSAVLAAHVDYAGLRGAFFDLRALAEGAEVVVQGLDGREVRFVVTSRAQVHKDDLPVAELFRLGGPPTLTLITCGGSFDPSARHYHDNIVVRAARA